MDLVTNNITKLQNNTEDLLCVGALTPDPFTQPGGLGLHHLF